MKFKLTALILALLPLFVSCGGNKNENQNQNQNESEATSKTLVLYYSQTGATKTVAELLKADLGADIDSIVPKDSYGTDYEATIQRWQKEKNDNVKVAIKQLSANINDYDTIFLGFPIWGGTFASPVATWLADNNLKGKTVITFATFGSGGIEAATKDVALAQPSANVIEGFGIRNARIDKAPAEIKSFLIDNGYIAGEKSSIPEYGETAPVTEEDVKIFNEACGNYQFPLGTPISVARRQINGATEYCFNVESDGPDDKKANSIIYVTAAPDQKPEFTKVVRQ